jgi:hypothetical protein
MSELDTPSDDPTLAELLQLFGRSLALDLRVSAPATVIAYPDSSGGATVQLGALPVDLDEQPGAPIVLPGVPVAWLGGSGAYLTTPLPPGSTGWVIFSDRAIGQWLQAGAPVDPKLGRTHALGDGVFLPCRIGVGAVPVTSPAATVVEGPLVQVGAGAVAPAVLGTQLAAAFTTWTGALATAGTTWTAAAGGPPYAANLPPISGAYIAAVIAATTALATTIAGWLSTTVTVKA